MKTIVAIISVLLIACGSGESGEDVGADAQISSEGEKLTLHGTYEYDDWSDCQPGSIYDEKLSLYTDKNFDSFMILNANDEIFMEGNFNSSQTFTYDNYIDDEKAECFLEIEPTNCIEGSDVACHPERLNSECQSANYECQIYWDKI